MKHLIDITDFSVEELKDLMDSALDIIASPEKYQEKCKNKQLATLFFEPSTRTRLSFESAMHNLGGNVIGFSEASSSSATKGESVADTIKMASNYVDIIAIRSPKEGCALVSALNSGVPVINAGDGGHCHPTQTLTDLLTIYREKGGFDNLTVGLCGDLKYGRTVHSLIAALSRYKNVKLVLISPNELRIPSHVLEDIIKANNMEYIEVTSLEDNLADLDVLYMTRIQRERFTDADEYERLKNSYVLDVEKMNRAPEKMIVLHPLPRVNEISVKVDKDPRALYFKQSLNGKFIRMALILKLLNEKDKEDNVTIKDSFIINKYVCKNPKCICQTEQELDNIAKETDNGVIRCIYCEQKVN